MVKKSKHKPAAKKSALPQHIPGPALLKEPAVLYNTNTAEEIASNEEIVFAARKGIAATLVFDTADNFHMPDKQLTTLLNTTVNTVKNYIAGNKYLPAVTAEHLLKLVALFKKGGALFGNVYEFKGWLGKPSFTLNEAPYNLLNTPGGVDYIINELEKIEFGYPV